MTSSVSTNDMSDPLKPFIPSNETPEDKRSRILAEKEAKKKSETIDKQIKAEKEKLNKQKVSKLLLLGIYECACISV
jgi:hypothetical protein